MTMSFRDRLGRPLRGIGSESNAFPQVPERENIAGEVAWNEAMNYFHRSLPFHVHEVCEQRWRCAPDPERSLWRGLAQWGAALTHKARGNDSGSRRLAQRARDTMASAGDVPPYIDIEFVQSSIDSLLE